MIKYQAFNVKHFILLFEIKFEQSSERNQAAMCLVKVKVNLSLWGH